MNDIDNVISHSKPSTMHTSDVIYIILASFKQFIAEMNIWNVRGTWPSRDVFWYLFHQKTFHMFYNILPIYVTSQPCVLQLQIDLCDKKLIKSTQTQVCTSLRHPISSHKSCDRWLKHCRKWVDEININVSFIYE